MYMGTQTHTHRHTHASPTTRSILSLTCFEIFPPLPSISKISAFVQTYSVEPRPHCLPLKKSEINNLVPSPLWLLQTNYLQSHSFLSCEPALLSPAGNLPWGATAASALKKISPQGQWVRLMGLWVGGGNWYWWLVSKQPRDPGSGGWRRDLWEGDRAGLLPPPTLSVKCEPNPSDSVHPFPSVLQMPFWGTIRA